MTNVTKIVNKTCANDVRFSAIEAAGADSFAKCADSGVGPRRNTSSHCWLEAFFATVLGPQCSEPDCVVTGMPLANLLGAWELPFAPLDRGGCAALPAPPASHQHS